MEENRLNGLSLLNIHYQIDIKPEELGNRFVCKTTFETFTILSIKHYF